MKLRGVFIGLIAVVFFVTGLWGSAAAIPYMHANKDKKIEKKKTEKRRFPRTKFAFNTIDAVRANQLILMSTKTKKK